jgi:hypothetical protein
MGEESKIRDAADAVRGVLETPIVEDALHPGAKQVGKTIETVGKAINLAISPIAGLVWAWETIWSYLGPALEERLRGVSPENIVTPSPTVAGPAIEALRFAGREESLRDLYANLLATAMDRETAYRAHPAFVEILKQLSPDEAKLLSLMATLPEYEMALINVRSEVFSQASVSRSLSDVLRHFYTLGERAGCTFPDLANSYLDNFERLGLIEVDDVYHWAGEEAIAEYERLEQHPKVLDARAEIEQTEGSRVDIGRGLIRITVLGSQFIEACVVDRSAASPRPELNP